MVYLPHWPTSNKSSIAKHNGLVGIALILEKLGNPHKNLPPVIHIAGTNGKGSTAAFLASIFQAANYKTHINISPHIHHCNERITIANHHIDDNYLYMLLEEVRIASNNQPVSLHEGLTLAAILAFSQNKADICIIETGMGGRIDITNVIDDKILTLITTISHDHTEYLGTDIAAIAAEKSYIMRKQVPAIIAHQAQPAGAMIEIRGLEIDAPLIHYGQNFEIEINADSSFNFNYSGKNLNSSLTMLPEPALKGQHQYLNASLAIAGIIAVKDFGTSNFNIDKTAISQGLKSVKWPSRLEKINNNLNSLLKNIHSEIWIDGAHNNGGAYILANWLKEKRLEDAVMQNTKLNYTAPSKEGKQYYLIVGFTKGKAKKEFFDQFQGVIDFICPIRVQGESNPENPQIIEKEIIKSRIKTQTQDTLLDAIDFLANLNSKQPCLILICGSLYLARDVKKAVNAYAHWG